MNDDWFVNHSVPVEFFCFVVRDRLALIGPYCQYFGPIAHNAYHSNRTSDKKKSRFSIERIRLF